MSQDIISINNITKRYKRKEILTNVSLNIKARGAYCLLGHNGSGKSTMLRIAARLTNVEAGTVCHHRPLKINYVPEHFPRLNMTPRQFIRHTAAVEGLDRDKARATGKELFHSFFMEQMADVPMRFLSKGTLQKTAVIQALMAAPDLLMLDEPLSGQDVESQLVFIRMVKEWKAQGTALLLSCHERFLAQQLTEYVYEIKDRQIQPLTVGAGTDQSYDRLWFEPPAEAADIPSAVTIMTHSLDFAEGQIVVSCLKEHSNPIIAQLLPRGYQLRRMEHETI